MRHAAPRPATTAPTWLPRVLLTTVGVVAVALAAVVVLSVTGALRGEPAPQPASGPTSDPGSAAGSAAGSGQQAGGGPGEASAEPGAPQPAAPAGAVGDRAAESWAREVLGGWDRARERAWQDEDPDALRSLYVAGSTAGERDAELLARWTEAGVEVRALRLRLDDLRVLALSPRRAVLEVTDRLRVRAVAEAGGEAWQLGRDRPSTRVVELRRAADAWRVARVVPTGGA